MLWFQMQRLNILKTSQSTIRKNNDDLGLFLLSTFRFWLDSEQGNSFLSQEALPYNPWRLHILVIKTAGSHWSIFLWRSWAAVWEKIRFPYWTQPTISFLWEHFCVETYYPVDLPSLILLINKSLQLNLRVCVSFVFAPSIWSCSWSYMWFHSVREYFWNKLELPPLPLTKNLSEKIYRLGVPNFFGAASSLWHCDRDQEPKELIYI